MKLLSRQRRPRRTGEWTDAKVVTFIVTLAATQSVTLAARRSAMSRKAAYALKSRDPAFAGAYDFGSNPDFAALFPKFLSGLPNNSVVMCHPGFVDDELMTLDPLTNLRESEYAFFASEAFPEILREHGVTLS